MEEPSTYVDDEEIEERDDFEDEDDNGEEIDEQTRKELENLNKSDEASKLQEVKKQE